MLLNCDTRTVLASHVSSFAALVCVTLLPMVSGGFERHCLKHITQLANVICPHYFPSFPSTDSAHTHTHASANVFSASLRLVYCHHFAVPRDLFPCSNKMAPDRARSISLYRAAIKKRQMRNIMQQAFFILTIISVRVCVPVCAIKYGEHVMLVLSFRCGMLLKGHIKRARQQSLKRFA